MSGSSGFDPSLGQIGVVLFSVYIISSAIKLYSNAVKKNVRFHTYCEMCENSSGVADVDFDGGWTDNKGWSFDKEAFEQGKRVRFPHDRVTVKKVQPFQSGRLFRTQFAI